MEDKITLKEAAAISGYHQDYISYLIRTNKVQGEKVGRNWFTTKAEIERYLSTKQFFSVQRLLKDRRVIASFAVVVIAGIVGLMYFLTTSETSPSVTKANQSLQKISEDEQSPLIISR
jgi:hypothetical protein